MVLKGEGKQEIYFKGKWIKLRNSKAHSPTSGNLLIPKGLAWKDGGIITPVALRACIERLLFAKRCLVHCFAGVHRTGTVLAVLGALVDHRPLVKVAHQLRSERHGSIGTQEQYLLAHEVSDLDPAHHP